MAGFSVSTIGLPLPTLDTQTITAREIAIVRLVSQARGNRGIARDLGISASTVSVHIRHIIRKFDLHRYDEPRVAIALMATGLPSIGAE